MMIAACKLGLYSVIKYSQQRLAVGPTGESDTPIMSFQLQQNALLPLLARTVVINFGHIGAKRLFVQNILKGGKDIKHKIVKTLCVTKAMVSWHGCTCA